MGITLADIREIEKVSDMLDVCRKVLVRVAEKTEENESPAQLFMDNSQKQLYETIKELESARGRLEGFLPP